MKKRTCRAPRGSSSLEGRFSLLSSLIFTICSNSFRVHHSILYLLFWKFSIFKRSDALILLDVVPVTLLEISHLFLFLQTCLILHIDRFFHRFSIFNSLLKFTAFSSSWSCINVVFIFLSLHSLFLQRSSPMLYRLVPPHRVLLLSIEWLQISLFRREIYRLHYPFSSTHRSLPPSSVSVFVSPF